MLTRSQFKGTTRSQLHATLLLQLIYILSIGSRCSHYLAASQYCKCFASETLVSEAPASGAGAECCLYRTNLYIIRRFQNDQLLRTVHWILTPYITLQVSLHLQWILACIIWCDMFACLCSVCICYICMQVHSGVSVRMCGYTWACSHLGKEKQGTRASCPVPIGGFSCCQKMLCPLCQSQSASCLQVHQRHNTNQSYSLYV